MELSNNNFPSFNSSLEIINVRRLSRRFSFFASVRHNGDSASVGEQGVLAFAENVQKHNSGNENVS